MKLDSRLSAKGYRVYLPGRDQGDEQQHEEGEEGFLAVSRHVLRGELDHLHQLALRRIEPGP